MAAAALALPLALRLVHPVAEATARAAVWALALQPALVLALAAAVAVARLPVRVLAPAAAAAVARPLVRVAVRLLVRVDARLHATIPARIPLQDIVSHVRRPVWRFALTDAINSATLRVRRLVLLQQLEALRQTVITGVPTGATTVAVKAVIHLARVIATLRANTIARVPQVDEVLVIAL